jgi:hypothetical protein
VAQSTRHDTSHPGILLIDGDEARGQRIARALTLADYRSYVATALYQGLQRCLAEPGGWQALVLGHVDWDNAASELLLTRLVQRLAAQRTHRLPALLFPSRGLTPPALLARQDVALIQLASAEDGPVLEAIGRAMSSNLRDTQPLPQARVITLLPALGFEVRSSTQMRSRNAHGRQALRSAHDLIGHEHWETLIADAGLAPYREVEGWPLDDNDRTVPAEHLSCLNQTVERSQPSDPAGQLRHWGELIIQALLSQRAPTALAALSQRRLPAERAIPLVLDAFTRELNDIRGEDLHQWLPRPDGCYWLVHYSNLFAYGRARRAQPVCHVWIGALQALVRATHLENALDVTEMECGCQTQTGHCLFALQRR